MIVQPRGDICIVFETTKPDLHDLVNPLTPPKTEAPEHEQSSRGSPEPPQIVHFLARDFEVAAKHAGHDVHGQDNSSKDGQFAKDVGGLDGS